MIIDSHVYCFRPLDGPNGPADAREQLRWVQASYAGHHQPAYRLRDRAPASSRALDPEGRGPLGELPDVGFRADHAGGRFLWTLGGQDCTKQFLPPSLRNVEFTPHSLIGEMDYADVDAALIHTNPMLCRDSRYLADCVAAYPDRLRAMAPVDEWRIADEAAAVTDNLRAAIERDGLHAIKFNVMMACRGSSADWDDGPYRSFWQATTSWNVPVFFTFLTSAQPSVEISAAEHRDRYVKQLDILMRWMHRYPDTVCCLTHGFPYRVLLDGGKLSIPDAFWAPFDHPKCHLEVCFPARLGDKFDYPYHELWPTLEQMVARIGAERLLWGTDMPFQNRTCTYRQSRDWIEKDCTFLGRDELAMIMGGTAARILHLEQGD